MVQKRQVRRCDITAFRSHQAMFRQTPASRDNFQLYEISSAPIVFGNEMPDMVDIFDGQRRELKSGSPSYGLDRSERRFRSISIAASPSINSPRSACTRPVSM